VLCFLRAEKQCERSNVGRFAQPAQTVLGGGLLLQLFYRFARSFRSLLRQLIETLRVNIIIDNRYRGAAILTISLLPTIYTFSSRNLASSHPKTG
jgi:hypothetical protein